MRTHLHLRNGSHFLISWHHSCWFLTKISADMSWRKSQILAKKREVCICSKFKKTIKFCDFNFLSQYLQFFITNFRETNQFSVLLTYNPFFFNIWIACLEGATFWYSRSFRWFYGKLKTTSIHPRHFFIFLSYGFLNVSQDFRCQGSVHPL